MAKTAINGARKTTDFSKATIVSSFGTALMYGGADHFPIIFQIPLHKLNGKFYLEWTQLMKLVKETSNWKKKSFKLEEKTRSHRAFHGKPLIPKTFPLTKD